MKNQLKTVALLALMTALLLYIGQLFGTGGLVIAGIIVVIMNFGSYFFSDKLVLSMYRAKKVQAAEYPELYKIVSEVSNLAGIPMPKVYVVQNASPNAFATGRNPRHAAVAVTSGILQLLDKDELKGVIAHEVSHVKNRDILIGTIAGTIAGVIGFVASMARWAAIFGGFGGRDEGDGGGIIGLLVMAIVAPLMAMIIQMAVSRSREYLADESAAKMLHNPYGLASALERLESGIKATRPLTDSKATAHMFISNPLKDNGFMTLFSTHPQTKDRIAKLRSMTV